jgi:uncharacterized protein YdhG (YjbR/CyaY superfamily)
MTAIDTYLETVTPQQKEALERIRTIVQQAVPNAEETISYGMPAFKYNGQPLVYYAAFKDHMSLFPTSGPTKVLKDKLQAFTVSKGTIQFTLEKPLPEALIREILDVRLTEIQRHK